MLEFGMDCAFKLGKRILGKGGEDKRIEGFIKNWVIGQAVLN